MNFKTLILSLAVASPLAAQTADPRVGLRAGKFDAAIATMNMRLVSTAPPPQRFIDGINSDLAFFGHYVVQGSFNGYQVWDISNPAQPKIRKEYFCPASQSDVSMYKNLLFVSAESNSSRLDCGDQGIRDTVSHDRIRGIRIFDMTNIDDPKYIANVQTCRGSHTHSLLVDPKDKDNVYIYISGSSPVRSPSELAGCTMDPLDRNPNSALMRIEIIKVPLANPARAAIVATPRIFQDLKAPATHGLAHDDSVAAEMQWAAMVRSAADNLARAKATNAITAKIPTRHPITGEMTVVERTVNALFVRTVLDSIVKARGGSGEPTSADSSVLRGEMMQGIVDRLSAVPSGAGGTDPMMFAQCHDITLFPSLGLAGGACEGHGLLLDISNPIAPIRLDAVSDKNFSYWHSATFNNDGTKVLFSDEWGGGGGPKCRASDPKEWGADAIFTIENKKLTFQSYYKLPAPQTSSENCVAHNGSLVPIPGRDVMVQAWYQGGISVFDWTDAKNPREIAFFDRGPADSTRLQMAGSWSVYWYNGAIVSSEIARGLDILELTPSQHLSQNEIDAARTVTANYLNAQGQPRFVWPPSFSLSRAYVDQIERSKGVSAARLTAIRNALTAAEKRPAAARRTALTRLATSVDADARRSSDSAKVTKLAASLRELAK
ncbi:MAG: hypothetical protein ABIR92_08380 [Gemmatimonadaceae bacterium]